MPVGPILSAKEAEPLGYQPLLLAVITFADNSVYRVATHSITYAGHACDGRIVNQDIAASQALSDQGIDIPASVMLRLSDADYYVWNNLEKTKGFKGSTLELRAIMYDFLTNEASTDSRVIFRGICKEPGGRMPSHDGKVFSAGYLSRLGMADLSLPSIRVQRTCPWDFPSTAAQRQAGADDPSSHYYRCGYSPDAAGSNARGNFASGSAPYTSCPRTKDACVARGMYTRDSLDRVTGRFGGVQWTPPQAATVREYVTGKWITVQGGANEARYGDFVPMLWGTAWTDPLILNTVPDGNFLKMEALVCYGELDYIYEVVVNDVRIPHTFDDGELPNVPPGVPNAAAAYIGGWWKTTNRGDRDGSPTNDAGYTAGGIPQGDPYGSLAVIEIVVPRRIADAGSIPRVRVLARRGDANPARQLRDILQSWAGWRTPEMDIASFDAAAAVCDETITFQNQFGGTSTGPRYSSSLYLRQRESVAEIVRGLRNTMKGVLSVDAAGRLRLISKRTLGDQQETPVAGSNDNTPVSSIDKNGNPKTGFVAYSFNESNILDWPAVTETTAGNRYVVQFHNAENRYSFDSFNPIDSDDIARVDQEVPGSFTMRGADNYDLLARLIATYTAEQYRGNWRGDSGGTVVFEFTISFRGVHLSIGDICRFSFAPLGVTAPQLVRILRIQPSTNFQTAQISAAWMADEWYTDSYGQKAQPRHSGAASRNRLLRPAFAWLPRGEQPVIGDSLYARTDWGFGAAQKYEIGADGTALAKLAINGKQPVNVTVASPSPPFVPLQGVVAPSGGSIGPGMYYVAVTAAGADGKQSALSDMVSVYVPSGATNKIQVTGIQWDPATVSHVVYAGTDPNRLSRQFAASGSPSTIELDSLQVATYGAPDGEFDKFRFRVKEVLHFGVWGAEVVSVTPTTIRVAVPGSGLAVNQCAGYDLAWVGDVSSPYPLPICHFPIASNTSDTLTIAPGGPDPVAAGLGVKDVVVLMSRPAYGEDATGKYVEDPAWVNAYYPGGLSAVETGYVMRVIAGTGRGLTVRVKSNTTTRHYGDFPVALDSSSRIVWEEANWRVISDSASLTNGDPDASFYGEIDISNYKEKTVIVQALTLDGGETESVEASSPVRVMYVFGKPPGIREVTTDTTVTIEDETLICNTAGGAITVTLMPARERTGRELIIVRHGPNEVVVVAAPGDTISGSSSYTITADGGVLRTKAQPGG